MKFFLFLLFSLPIFINAVPPVEDGCEYVYRLPKNLNLARLEANAEKQGCVHLLRAIRATQAFYSNKNSHIGIKKRDFLQTALFIETFLQDFIEQKQYFLTKKDTDLKYTIEHDPETKQTFIVLDSKKAFVGEGAKKKVYKAILYCPEPKILARGEQTAPMGPELKANKALQGAPGLIKTYAFTQHKVHKKKYTTIYSDLYTGTFRELLKKKHLSVRKKVVLITDVLRGIESIHSRNFVHRDLHANNYLTFVQKEPNGKRTIHAVIADLGRTIELSKAKKLPAQGARRLCPPEGFREKKLSNEDYFATDIYALGCIFHTLWHNKQSPWLGHYLKSDDLTRQQKKIMLIRALKKANSERRKFLLSESESGKLTVKQDMELLILKMLYKDPERRATATYCRKEAERILNRL